MSYPEFLVTQYTLCDHCADGIGTVGTEVPLAYALEKLGYYKPDPLGLGINWERLGERLTAKFPPKEE